MSDAGERTAPTVTPHQAAVLGKKMVLVKRYSATEAMLIHATAAAAESERASSVSTRILLPLSNMSFQFVN